jgi:hypothetical protein
LGTFASILYDQGVDLKAISKALGQSDLGTTNKIYTHTFDKTHKTTVSALSSALKRIVITLYPIWLQDFIQKSKKNISATKWLQFKVMAKPRPREVWAFMVEASLHC